MARDGKQNKNHKKKGGASRRKGAGYVSARKPKLRGITLIEPEPKRFGTAPEDGLRMLAALETLPSLEPDFGDDPTAEAAVTIVEGAPSSEAAEPQDEAPAGSLRARLHHVDEAPDVIAEEYAAYHGPVEEAEVEIIELPGCEPEISARPRRRRRPFKRGSD